MQLKVRLPAYGVEATLRLYVHRAPAVSHLIWESLVTPLDTMTHHACFSGHQVFCFLNSLESKPPIENQTLRPSPGEAMFFHSSANEFAFTAEQRLGSASGDTFELAFMYGAVDLRHWFEEGLRGSLIGRMEGNTDGFAAACRATLDEGSTRLLIFRSE